MSEMTNEERELLLDERELRMWCIEQAKSVASTDYQLVTAAEEIRRFVVGEAEAKQEEAA